MWWEATTPTVSGYIAVRFLNNIIKKTPIRSIMTDVTEEEERWIAYFDKEYTKREMIIKYIRRTRGLIDR